MVDQSCLNDALMESAKEVFETMVFMDLAECFDDEAKIEGSSLLGTITFRITFEGRLDGCMTIYCSTDCARAIAMNMLAMDPDEEISEAEVSDAIGEITNMVMGSVKTRVQDRVGSLDVSIPTVITGRELDSSLGDGANKAVIRVSLDGEHLMEFALMYREIA